MCLWQEWCRCGSVFQAIMFLSRHSSILCLFLVCVNWRTCFANGVDPELISRNDNNEAEMNLFENEEVEYKHGEPLLIWSIKLPHHNDYSDKTTADLLADKIAQELELVNLGQIGELRGHYTLVYIPGELVSKVEEIKHTLSVSHVHKLHKRHVPQRSREVVRLMVEERLAGHSGVEWFQQEVVRLRHKRTALSFHDAQYSNEWHIVNHKVGGSDINVTGVWERNVTGVGAVVCVVDDGVEWQNKDLTENFSWDGSWDLNDEDSDPTPQGPASNHHGTRCAGEIAAVPNDVCAVGVAYGAKVSGIRVLDGPLSDALEAAAFNKKLHVNDVYSCSWGPDDNGKTVDGPHRLAAAAIKFGIDFGRKGFGVIYVVASGNGGRHEDNCNYDGYANSIYTVTVGAVDEFGHMPRYGENCSAMLSVTYSNGHQLGARKIVTTDWSKYSKTLCTDRHSGTSAAAPIAAGMIALMYQVRPCLTWRDVQYIIVMTAIKVDVDVVSWQRNQAGLHHSHQHGFGLMKAWRLVNAAKVWKNVPWMMSYMSDRLKPDALLPKDGSTRTFSYTVTEAMLAGYDLTILEQVQVIVTITAKFRGGIYVELECPSGTDSVLGTTRSGDDSTKGLHLWTFTTVRCWGEAPTGNYKLTVAYKGKDNDGSHLVDWQLRLFGTDMTPTEFMDRRRFLKEHAYSGKFLNDTYEVPCPSPPVKDIPQKDVVSEWTLKILFVVGLFCIFMITYEAFEYRLCYGKEQKEHKKLMRLTAHARHLAHAYDNEATRPYTDRTGDYFQLPTEDDNDGDGVAIQMTTLSRNDSTSPVLSQPVHNGNSSPGNHLGNGVVDRDNSSHGNHLGNGSVDDNISIRGNDGLGNGTVDHNYGNRNNNADSGVFLETANAFSSSPQQLDINNDMTTANTDSSGIYPLDEISVASSTGDIVVINGVSSDVDSEGLFSKSVEPSSVGAGIGESADNSMVMLEGLQLGNVEMDGERLEMDQFALARAGNGQNE